MKRSMRTLSLVLSFCLWMTMFGLGVTVQAEPASSAAITYQFTGNQSGEPGYAQGTIRFTAGEAGTYRLYWADDQKALEGYLRIAKFELSAGQQGSVTFGYHTVIPAGATKIIACLDSNTTVSSAKAVYDIPVAKRFDTGSGNLLYSFSAFSDIHIDRGSNWYKDADTHLREGLQYSVDHGSDYIVVSGDVVTNDSGPDKEWKAYQSILSESDYVNPIWESDGNHDMRQDVVSGLKSFIKGSGVDGTKEAYDADRPYFYRVEEKTGDLFLFMALETSSAPANSNEFSDPQLTWARDLVETYTQKGVNVFLVQHAPIKGFGAGDRMDNPYYGGLMKETYASTVAFKQLLLEYPNIIWVSGHTHEDFVMDYNYSNSDGNGGIAANMIHIPALAGSTMPNERDDDLERNEGHGFHSQGYFVQVYENKVVFNGVNIAEGTIYPLYSYVMDSLRATSHAIESTEQNPEPVGVNVSLTSTLQQASTVLKTYYQYASYDQYQAVKKLYYTYKNSTTGDQSVVDQFTQAIAALKDIAEHTGMPKTYPVGKEYYFENNLSWSKVYAYAWTGSSHNAEWPGVVINKVGTSNGKDLYKVTFNSEGEYQNLIFNDGSSQTVDIPLYEYQYDAFRTNGTSDGKYKVKNFSRSGTPDPDPDPEDGDYALLYYVENQHDWSDTNTKLTSVGNGLYQTVFTAGSTLNISLSVYDKKAKTYKSLSESVGVDYAPGLEQQISLVSQSSRGKSLTVRSMAKGNTLTLTYNAANNTLTYKTDPLPELKNLSTISATQVISGQSVTITAAAQDGAGGYTYVLYDKKPGATYYIKLLDYSTNTALMAKLSTVGEHTLCAKVKDSAGRVIPKYFTVQVTPKLANVSTYSASQLQVGDTLTVHAAATGGTGTYEFAIFYKKPGAADWISLKPYSAVQDASLKLKVTGTYDICVRARDSSGTLVRQYGTVEAMPALKNLSTLSSATLAAGQAVTVTGAAQDGTGGYTYVLYDKKPGATSYIKLLDYRSDPSLTAKLWTVGEHTLCAKVKDSTGHVMPKYFTVNVTEKLTNTSTLSSGTVSMGNSVTINASATGGTAPYTFSAYYKKSGASSFTQLQALSSNKTITFKPSAAATYTIRTKVKDANGTFSVKDLTITVS